MKAVSVWKTSLLLVGTLASACGEVPGGAQESQGLFTTHQALACSTNDTTPPELSIKDQNLFYECTGAAIGNTWVPPDVKSIKAVDACEGPLVVHRLRHPLIFATARNPSGFLRHVRAVNP